MTWSALDCRCLIGEIEDIVASSELPSAPAAAFAPDDRILDFDAPKHALVVFLRLSGDEPAGIDIPACVGRISTVEQRRNVRFQLRVFGLERGATAR